MNPSPNRSSKSRKSSPPHKGDLSEQVVNLPTTPVSVSSSEDDTSAPVEPAVPVEPAKPFGVTDSLASVEVLQRPHPRPSEEPAVSQVNPDSTAVSADDSDSPASEDESQLVSDEAEDRDELSADRTAAVLRHHPIPPPSEPRQYRAVGLVRGRYAPSAEQFTRGVLLSSEGTAIDAVLLGRVMSLVKNHLNLEQEHLWVVYPRTRQQDGNLHTQIMGVWEPETLNKPKSSASEEEGEDMAGEADSSLASPTSILPSMPNVEEGYFSIRGEVIYQSQEEKKYVIVKIKQSPRKDGDKIKFFKLKLNGALAEKAVAHFWDFHVQLEADNLVIQQANDIGSMPIKKKKFGAKPGGFKGKRPFVKKNGDAPRPDRRGPKTPVGAPTVRKEGVPKPVKRSKPSEE